jgi:hypothetical protein
MGRPENRVCFSDHLSLALGRLIWWPFFFIQFVIPATLCLAHGMVMRNPNSDSKDGLAEVMTGSARRFPPPWTVEETQTVLHCQGRQ